MGAIRFYKSAVALVTLLSVTTWLGASPQSGDAEYLVRADGAVITLSGEVIVNYILPSARESVQATVPAGFSFIPDSGTVVPTSPAFLHDIIADIVTTQHSGRSFKVADGGILIVRT